MPKQDNQLYIHLKENSDSLSKSEKLKLCINPDSYEITTRHGSKILIFTLLESFISRVNNLLQQNDNAYVKSLKIQSEKETHLSVPDSMDFESPKQKLPTQFHVTLACYDGMRKQDFKFILYFNLEGILLETDCRIKNQPISSLILEKFTSAILEVTEFHDFIAGLDEMIRFSDTPSVHSDSLSSHTTSAAASKRPAASSKQTVDAPSDTSKSSSAVDTGSADAIKAVAIAIFLEQCQGLLQDIIANPEVPILYIFKNKFPRNISEVNDIQHFSDMFFAGDNDKDPIERRNMVEQLLKNNDDTIIYVIQAKIIELYSLSVANNLVMIDEYEAELNELISNFIADKHTAKPSNPDTTFMPASSSAKKPKP